MYYNPIAAKLASLSARFSARRRSNFEEAPLMKLYAAMTTTWQDLLAQILKTDFALDSLPEIARTERGKPYFPAHPDLHFNISNAGPYTLCAVSRRPVGVDIEVIRPRKQSLVPYSLTERELGQYHALGSDWPAFYTLWTKKEAWAKFTGIGLADQWGQDAPEDLMFHSYEGDGWRAAVCSEGPAPDTITWLENDALTKKLKAMAS